MPAIRLTIGAHLDPSAVNVLAPLLAAMQRARAQIASESKALGQDIAKGYRDAPGNARKAFGDAAKAAEDGNARIRRSARTAADEQTAAAEHVFRVKVRYFEEEARAAEAAMQRQRSAARSVFTGAAGNFAGMARGALGVTGQIARGAGVNLDIGSLVGRTLDTEKRAGELSSAAYMPGAAGAAGQRQDPKVLISEARATADAVALDTNKALEGLQAFVGKTGDLETGRAIFRDLAVYSKATGTELEDMISAAGDVSLAFGDTENKSAKILSVMRGIAGQGKLGAVEIKDLSVQMAKISAQAPQFQGKIEDTLLLLGAFAQEARQRGGAASASQAANSVSGLVQIFKTPARVKAFAAEGIDVFDKKSGLIRNPQILLEEALRKRGMDPVGFKKMFANMQGGRAVEGFASIYRQAGGGETGMAAVRAEFDRLKKSTMGQGEIQESFARAMGTNASKVQLFNNALDRIAEQAAGRVLPAMEQLGPGAIKAAGGLADLAVFVAENPIKAAMAGAAASITAEAGKLALKSLLEKAIGGGASSGVLGAAGIALTIGVATIAIESAMLEMKEKAEARTQDSMIEGLNAREQARAARERGKYDPEAAKALQTAIADQEQRIQRGSGEGHGIIGGALSGIASLVTGNAYGSSFAAQAAQKADAEQLAALKAEMAANKAELAKMNAKLGGELKVVVTNQPMGAVPGTTTGPGPLR